MGACSPLPGILAVLTLALPVSAQSFDPVGSITGPARVVDGDGLRILQIEVRLRGIAAPEWNEPGGQEATDALGAMIEGQAVTCYLDGTRAQDRVVGECYVGGQDVAQAVIRAGLALDCARFSRGHYAPQEDAAAREGSRLRETYQRPGYCVPR